MSPDPSLPAHLVVPIVFAAALVSAIVGFAFSAIAGAAIAMLGIQPTSAVEVLLVSSMASQCYAVWSLRESIDWERVAPFVAGGLVTVPIGVALLIHATSGAYSTFIGMLVLAYAAHRLLASATTRGVLSPRWDPLVGAVGGLTGGLAAFPGAPVAAWCAERGWTKEEQRGVYQPYILVMQTLALVCLGSHPGTATVVHALPYAPVALVGTVLGLGLFRRLSTPQFGRVLNVILVVSGALLLARGLA